MPVALITGASRGLGRATARALAGRGWSLVLDARGATELRAAVPAATAIAGNVADPAHRDRLLAAVRQAGQLELLMNNASTLGPSPLPDLAGYPAGALREVFEVDVLAPLALLQLVLPLLPDPGGVVVNVSSDAAVEAYPGWGGYGAAKAALDRLTAVLAAERPGLRVYAFDPGDMRTALHQQAYPGEDISDRPPPESVVPALLRLIDERPSSGRYRSAELTPR